jgi:hypothetical protein
VLLFIVLLVANLLVANVIYNLYKAEKGTPIWESVKSNVVYNYLKPKRSSNPGYASVTVHNSDSDAGTVSTGEEAADASN